MNANSEPRNDEQLTDLIRLAAEGSSDAKERLYASIYEDLRKIARRLVANEHRPELQTTDLVNEVVLRFEAHGSLNDFMNRRMLFSVAVRAMRQVLVDSYRKRKKLIDSPDRIENPLSDLVASVERKIGYDVERLEWALAKLEADSPRQYAVMTHRFFGGLTIQETADLMEVSVPTVERDWRLARAKLFRWLNQYD